MREEGNGSGEAVATKS
ncbi:hypothetical protein E2C01_011575 [Portunus trituberculatus]|uniref:Uncharacterized protein n=1 Tax=Portunus trituberculatus TaxID=210409 RepID=A0A5B7DBI7_PORTR|nr:hypothetical protein [Portunus trituberculatus]